MMYLGPRIAVDAGLEQKSRYLRGFAGYRHFQSTNAFWIGEDLELGRHLYGEDAEPVIIGEAIFYKRKDNLPSRVSDDKANLELTLPSNSDPAYIPIRMQSSLPGFLLTSGYSFMRMRNGR